MTLYEIVERLGTLIRTSERQAGAELGLQPVHVHSLFYFSRCNKYSDTPAALTDYLGLTKGTVSQSIRVLTAKGYLQSHPDDDDGRKVHCSLTKQGAEALRSAVPPPILRELDDKTVQELTDKMMDVLRTVQRSQEQKTFGICFSCAHFRRKGLKSTHQCGLTLEPLFEDEIQQICREHEPPDP